MLRTLQLVSLVGSIASIIGLIASAPDTSIRVTNSIWVVFFILFAALGIYAYGRKQRELGCTREDLQKAQAENRTLTAVKEKVENVARRCPTNSDSYGDMKGFLLSGQVILEELKDWNPQTFPRVALLVEEALTAHNHHYPSSSYEANKELFEVCKTLNKVLLAFVISREVDNERTSDTR